MAANLAVIPFFVDFFVQLAYPKVMVYVIFGTADLQPWANVNINIGFDDVVDSTKNETDKESDSEVQLVHWLVKARTISLELIFLKNIIDFRTDRRFE
ncbi:hypothetical protein MXB_5472 [Myxobolus squamalis]|nr:hypothetical protein MXB_5472 [Myxobolus squamalis]